MKRVVSRTVVSTFRRLGFKLERIPSTLRSFPPDFDHRDIETVRAVRAYTMTSPERIVSLCNAVRYVSSHRIPGDIVECGVWKGGSMMAVARTLLEEGVQDRMLHLFDTFEGMTGPTDRDVTYLGVGAKAALATGGADSPIWARAPLESVRKAMCSTGYDESLIRYIVGPVEQTIPSQVPNTISLLRLDTDWYESTRHEWLHLYPRLSKGGAVIVDDYGHWDGARKATDEYLSAHRLKLLLNRIDYTGRIGVKVDA